MSCSGDLFLLKLLDSLVQSCSGCYVRKPGDGISYIFTKSNSLARELVWQLLREIWIEDFWFKSGISLLVGWCSISSMSEDFLLQYTSLLGSWSGEPSLLKSLIFSLKSCSGSTSRSLDAWFLIKVINYLTRELVGQMLHEIWIGDPLLNHEFPY